MQMQEGSELMKRVESENTYREFYRELKYIVKFAYVLDHRAFSKGTIPCRSLHVKIHQVVENDIRMRVYQALALNPNGGKIVLSESGLRLRYFKYNVFIP